MQQEGLQLAAAVLRSRWAEPFDVWAAVRQAWSGVRDQGGEATAARAAAMRAVEAVWGGGRVRDVTALPEPALVTGTGFVSPAQWADAEFQHRWQQYVLDRCDRLEEALGAATGEGGEGWQLVRVSGWPLTRKQDAELAYLAQYEQHGPAVPFGGRLAGYGIEPDHAVVLAVPRFATRHAADHTRDDRQRVILGSDLVAGTAEPDKLDMLALLRGAYPYLPADAEGDGPSARPTAMVTTARAVRRADQLGRRAAYSGPDSMEVYNDLAVGKYSWVPDDEHPGPAAAEMEHLPVHWLKDWPDGRQQPWRPCRSPGARAAHRGARAVVSRNGPCTAPYGGAWTSGGALPFPRRTATGRATAAFAARVAPLRAAVSA
ncbi:hypothetical protein DF19_07215 [Streptomyces olindensis]|nr:hypothetical protein DF19_07215 [Streptomyces olindensis]